MNERRGYGWIERQGAADSHNEPLPTHVLSHSGPCSLHRRNTAQWEVREGGREGSMVRASRRTSVTSFQATLLLLPLPLPPPPAVSCVPASMATPHCVCFVVCVLVLCV